MVKIKKGLAIFLAMLMLVSTMSIVALGEEVADYAVSEQVEEVVGYAAYEQVSEVVFNLGTLEVTVGFDEELYNGFTYMLFDDDGDFTITLEDNAFFPYEVQFRFGGQTFVEWFETPDCVVIVGEHVFSVFTEQNDPYMLQSIFFYVADERIVLRPDSKEFTHELFMPMSLLPLQTFNFSLDLTGLTPGQLRNVTVSTIFSGQTPPANDPTHVVWARTSDNAFQIIDYASGAIDLSQSTGSWFTLELIVGSGLQLDETNIRYRVSVTTSPVTDLFTAQVYTQAGDQGRAPVSIFSTWFLRSATPQNLQLTVDGNLVDFNDEVYLSLNWGGVFAGQAQPRVLLGSFADAASASAAVSANPEIDITNRIWNQTMTNPGTGFLANYFTPLANPFDRLFTLVETVGGQDFVTPFSISMFRSVDGLSWVDLYATSSADDNFWIVRTGRQFIQDGVRVFTVEVYADFPVNANYYLRANFSRQGSRNNFAVARAVLGHFTTAEEINAQPDIAAQLFPTVPGGGFYTNVSGAGQNFTAIDTDGNIFRFTVIATQSSISRPVPGEGIVNAPRPGSPDTFFRVTGATELQNSQVFIAPFQHDTYYDMGFQTVFYLEDVPLTALTPEFWHAQAANIYSGHAGRAGTPQASGQNTHDFSQGPVHYSVAAEDGTSQRNYWVTFVPRHVGGSRLFVNAINGDDGPRREVFLTSVHNNLHDILIANVGDAELTGLNAVLTNAVNIELCSYWTVGGAGNDTLAAFTSNSFQFSTSEFADNIAKIRIIPIGEGEISGTLTISSNDGQEPVVIEITGHAGDPRLLTETIPDAVRHVPFSVQLLHNNRFPWNQVTLELMSGTLPPGVAMRPNGEIYGVPQTTGTFSFAVRMTNSDTRFGSSQAQFTIVVQENTDEWVAWANEHDIIVPVPNVVTTFVDRIFEIDYEYNHFMRLFLAGQELVNGVDYIAEDGSTRITVRGQTIQRSGQGRQTIAAEFRVNRSEDSEMSRSAQNFTVATTTGGTGGGGGGATTINEPAVPLAPTPDVEDLPLVTPLPREDLVAGSVDDDTRSIIEIAVASLREEYEATTGKTLSQAGQEVTVSAEEPNTVATITLPTPADPSEIITMAMLNDDGTLTPVPTRVNPDGTVTVLISGTVILVPLSVEVNFTDINFGPQFMHVTDEIILAASLMIIQGRGNGIFDPVSMVTNQEAVTMFLRALGIPVEFSSAMDTALESGLNGIGANPNAPMSRIDTAKLIVNALSAIGMYPQISIENAHLALADFPDVDGLSDEELLALAICVRLGIFHGAADGSMNPDATLQRKQMASLAVRLQDVIFRTV